jgi:hypothetical protein
MSQHPVSPEAVTCREGGDANGFHASEKSGDGSLPAGSAESAQPGECKQVDRAEAMVERVAENVSSFTARWGRRAWSLVTRTREEAEDLWSEVQSIRRGNRP